MDKEKIDKDQHPLDEAYAYKRTGTDPDEATENRKRVIRKKASRFLVQNGELYQKKVITRAGSYG